MEQSAAYCSMMGPGPSGSVPHNELWMQAWIRLHGLNGNPSTPSPPPCSPLFLFIMTLAYRCRIRLRKRAYPAVLECIRIRAKWHKKKGFVRKRPEITDESPESDLRCWQKTEQDRGSDMKPWRQISNRQEEAGLIETSRLTFRLKTNRTYRKKNEENQQKIQSKQTGNSVGRRKIQKLFFTFFSSIFLALCLLL